MKEITISTAFNLLSFLVLVSKFSNGLDLPLIFLIELSELINNINLSVLFNLNGQMHGSLDASYLRKQSFGDFEYLRDDLFVVVDCSKLSQNSITTYFSADREKLMDNDESSKLIYILHYNEKY